MKNRGFYKRKQGVLIVLIGFLVLLFWPQKFTNPVKGAVQSDWNPKSFWYYPWGKSVTHKGVDIFAKKGTTVVASTGGLVVGKGNSPMGGNYILLLGPKWRVHYYAHLERIDCKLFHYKKRGSAIGKVGDTGNAKGKPPHLHYTIFTVLPYFWNCDSGPHGIRKMWYVNPTPFL